jgi:hypothetical protein
MLVILPAEAAEADALVDRLVTRIQGKKAKLGKRTAGETDSLDISTE